jgi:rare lipoprotein A
MRLEILKTLTVALAILLAACGSGRGSGSGGYYKDDGPPAQIPANIDRIPDATPRIEPLARGPNRPYTVMGQHFVPDTTDRPYRVRGIASWYGRRYHGRQTSNGERYDMFAMTAAHTTLPIPSYVRVTSTSNGRSVIVRINDRGPFLRSRVIDLSYVAAHRLGIIGTGSGEVIVERITPAQIRAGTWNNNPAAHASSASQTPQIPVAASVAARSSDSGAGAGTGPVYLQIGAFRESANAKTFAHRAAGAISTNLPIQIDETASDVYRVRIGPFGDREQALRAIPAIEQALGLTPTISVP